MTIKEILANWLKENGFEGIVCHDCGCDADDLFPCIDGPDQYAQPAYRVPASEEVKAEHGDDCEYIYTTVKPEKETP